MSTVADTATATVVGATVFVVVAMIILCATHWTLSETWSWHVKVNIQSLLLCPISDSHSRIFLLLLFDSWYFPSHRIHLFLPALHFLFSSSSVILLNVYAVCVRVRVGTKTLFGYSYVNRVSQQEKSKCVTMRYAHKIRVYGSKTFYRSQFFLCACMYVYMYSCRNYLISVSLRIYAWWHYSKICTFLYA